jgi:hypothetical protein
MNNVVSEIIKLDIEDGAIKKSDIEFTMPKEESGLNFLKELGAIEFDLERIDLVNKFRESELNTEELSELERLIKLYWEVKEQPDALPLVKEIAKVLGVESEEEESFEDNNNDEYFLVYELEDGTEYPTNNKVDFEEAKSLVREGFTSGDFKAITIKGISESYKVTADTVENINNLKISNLK